MEVLKIEDVCKYPAAGGIIFKVINNPVYLVKHTLFVFMFYTKLVTISFADRAVFISPLVPDVASEIFNIVAFFLPYP